MKNESKSPRQPRDDVLADAASTQRGAALHWRLLALVYDLFPLAAICMAGSTLVYVLNGVQPVETGSWQARLELMFLLVLCFGYYGVSWRGGGQTLGMRAWRIRLLPIGASPISWGALIRRWLIAWPSLGLFGIGYLAALLDPRRSSWPDRFSGTRIVRVPRRAK